MRDPVDTGDIKIIEQRLEHMAGRLDELLEHIKKMERDSSKAHEKLEVRVRSLEVDLERTKTRVMGLIAIGSFIIGPVLTWALQKL